MEQTTMVLRGRAGGDVNVTTEGADLTDRTTFGHFRLIVPRSRRKDSGEWEELEGHWYTVKAWGALARNLRTTIRRGDPVVVVGRPAANAWITGEGEIAASLVVHAVTVGHDCAYGVSSFMRPSRRPHLGAEEGTQNNETDVDTGAEVDVDVAGAGIDEKRTEAHTEVCESAIVVDAGNESILEVDLEE